MKRRIRETGQRHLKYEWVWRICKIHEHFRPKNGQSRSNSRL